MKIINRNTNYNSRLMRSLCLFAAGIFGAGGIIAAASVLTSRQSSYAANLTVVNDNFNGIDAVEVQFRPDEILMSKVDSVTLSGNLVRLSNANQAYLPSGTADPTDLIAIKKTDSIAGAKAVLRWDKAAVYPDGTELNVEMILDNFDVVSSGYTYENTNPDYNYLLTDWTNPETHKPLLHFSAYSSRVKFDVTTRVFTSGYTNPIDKKTILRFVDLDNNDADCAGSVDHEGVTLIDGIADGKIHLMQNARVQICNTDYGNNTRIVGTGPAANDPETGFAAYMNTGSMKYRWTGSDVGTGVGFIDFSKVITSTSGDYADKGKITVTDNEVLWKEDKKIVMTPDAGYKVSKVTVDGMPISFTPNANGVVEHTFNDVVSDHRIDVQFEPTTGYTLIVHHYLEGTEPPFSVADDVTKDGLTYDEHYTTEPAKNLDPKYELVKTPDNAEGDIKGNTEVIYYYRIVKGTVTVHRCKEGEDCSDPEPDPKVCAETGKKCEPLAEPEVSVCVRGDKVGITPKTFDHYYLVDSPDFTEADCDTNPEDPKDPIIYHYGQNGTVEVRFCDKATGNCNLAPIETDEGKDGDISEICKPKTISGYNLVDKNAEYDCFYSRDNNVVKIWYNKISNPIPVNNGIAGYIAGALGLVTATAGSIMYIIKRR